jgi:hypothetical protein
MVPAEVEPQKYPTKCGNNHREVPQLVVAKNSGLPAMVIPQLFSQLFTFPLDMQ